MSTFYCPQCGRRYEAPIVCDTEHGEAVGPTQTVPISEGAAAAGPATFPPEELPA
jgi:hypothetical protein